MLTTTHTTLLKAPAVLIEELPLSEKASAHIAAARREIRSIIKGFDDRLLVVVGPCSIDCVEAALEYGMRIQQVQRSLADDLCLLMRVYGEKSRTSSGWKGLIYDPHLDGSSDIHHGLYSARKLLVNLAERGVASATEFLNPLCTPFIADTISWGSIGARNSESQIHRELASGLPMPIGFKNGTQGNIGSALNGIYCAQMRHHSLGITQEGHAAIIAAQGNDSCHPVLRGDERGSNYSAKIVRQVSEQLRALRLHCGIMIDCSHGNSRKNYLEQKTVVEDVAKQIAAGQPAICGVMLESYLLSGNQPKQVNYGQSLTDSCLSFEETLPLLEQLAQAVRIRKTVYPSKLKNWPLGCVKAADKLNEKNGG